MDQIEVTIAGPLDPEELRGQAESELAGEDISFQLRRAESEERLDWGVLLAVLGSAAELVPLVVVLVKMLRGRKPDGLVRLTAPDGTTLEVPADTPVERIEELLKVGGRLAGSSRIRAELV